MVQTTGGEWTARLYQEDPSPAVAEAEKLLVDAEIAYDAKDELPRTSYRSPRSWRASRRCPRRSGSGSAERSGR
jgi:hypothetical protein